MNGDLISRYALRKSVSDEFERLNEVLYKYNDYYSATRQNFKTVLDLIDNTPSVEPPEQITMKFDCDTEEDRQKLLSLITKKPQGEWGKWVISEIRCPNCLEYFQTDCYSTEELNKCPNCGADMRGKDDE